MKICGENDLRITNGTALKYRVAQTFFDSDRWVKDMAK